MDGLIQKFLNDPTSAAPTVMWVLLLSLLLLPLLGSAITAFSRQAARRVALYVALLHVILTIVFITLSSGYIMVDIAEDGPANSVTFKPQAVPGDPGIRGGEESFSHRTAWSILSLAADAPPKDYLVKPEDDGKPLLDLLVRDKVMGHANRALTQRSLNEGNVSVNGAIAKLNNRAKSGDRIIAQMIDPVAVPSDIQFYVGVDGISLPLIGLTSLMIFLSILISWDTVNNRPAGYYGWILFLEFVLIGAFISFDILLFYIFFELTLVPSFFLIGNWGTGGGRRDAARKFVIYTLFGSLFTLVGIIGAVMHNPAPVNPNTNKVIYYDPHHETMNPNNQGGEYQLPRAGGVSFSIPTLIQNSLGWDMCYMRAMESSDRQLAEKRTPERLAQKEKIQKLQTERRRADAWIFGMLILGFVIKLPLVPFHSWLPAAYGEAPMAVTMLFSAVLAKLGAYGIIRIVIPVCSEAVVTYGATVFVTLGAAGIVYAALCAFAQRDLKMLAAYSSVSHLGLLAVGLFSMNTEGLQGATLQMVNHGLTAGGLFALLAFLQKRYGTTEIDQFTGLWGKYPVYTFFFILISLASVGLPGLNSFVGEMFVIAGTFDPRNVHLVGYTIAAISAFSIFLSSWYTFTVIRKVFFGPVRTPETSLTPPTDLKGSESFPVLIIAGFCLFFGLYPQPLIDLTRTDVSRVAVIADMARYRFDINQIPATRPRKPMNLPAAGPTDEGMPAPVGPDGAPIKRRPAGPGVVPPPEPVEQPKSK